VCTFRVFISQVVYVTAVVPYVVLIILLIWNAQLEGAWLGVKFYLIPEWSKLGNAKVRLAQHRRLSLTREHKIVRPFTIFSAYASYNLL